MAYVGKKLYAILQGKANQGDKKSSALLNQLNEMPQEEAEAQISIIMKGTKKASETNDEPTNDTASDPVAEKARDLVDSGEFSDYDQAYNLIVKQGIRQNSFQKSVNELPSDYSSDDILISTFKNAGFEVVKVDKNSIVVKVMGSEIPLPIERVGEQIKLRKENK